MEAAAFSAQDSEAIFNLAERLTGNSVRGNLMLANVARRLEATGARSLFEYLRHVEERPEELPFLISALLVHTTSWFREEPHFERLKSFAAAGLERFRTRPLRVLSAACSTGEEVYSLAIVLEELRRANPGFQYQVEGRDIDILCTKQGARAIYRMEDLERIPPRHRGHIMEGSGRTRGFFTLSEEIRSRCRFGTWNLVKLAPEVEQEAKFDFIACRNVLIYFKPETCERVIHRLMSLLRPDGCLVLGHTESIDPRAFGLEALGNSAYRPLPQARAVPQARGRSRDVLVIDDSRQVRRTLERLLEGTEFRCASVSSAAEATDHLRANPVDLVTLDLHMPGQSGRTWLAERRAAGLRVPVIVISDDFPSEAGVTFGALEQGAQDYFHKGRLITGKEELLSRFRVLVQAVEEREKAEAYALAGKLDLREPEVILLGASIGGPDALGRLIRNLGPESPPVVVVQHISVDFARSFAEHLARSSGLALGEPVHGARLRRGTLYMAWDNSHIGVKRRDGALQLVVSDADPVKRHRPSVDFLFASLAECGANPRVFAAILTGMGSDGAEGMLRLFRSGAMTFAQERRSCVVFSMAQEAVRLGGIRFVGTLAEIRGQLDVAMRTVAIKPPEAGQSE